MKRLIPKMQTAWSTMPRDATYVSRPTNAEIDALSAMPKEDRDYYNQYLSLRRRGVSPDRAKEILYSTEMQKQGKIYDPPLETVSPEFDLLTLGRGIVTSLAGNVGRSARKAIADNVDNYYRQGKNLYEDAIKSGVIRVKSEQGATNAIPLNNSHVFDLRKTFTVPFWNKGYKWFGNSKNLDVIVSKGERGLYWQPINQHGTFTTNLVKSAGRRTPLVNGKANIAPSNLFEYYRYYPVIGWTNITNGIPTMPITGLNTVYNVFK